ncbi:hypothetical protein G7Y89_g5899 [Cudoniella acicularis]|uniref:2EXR domain-containing protein n=1 Tax=Cudoniella acicularis TaxID=354080 RepID=A0A8H4RPU2_9HELO|nr:hypothetical protein G7Y89_g5899 [Cudoniella acicularis]
MTTKLRNTTEQHTEKQQQPGGYLRKILHFSFKHLWLHTSPDLGSKTDQDLEHTSTLIRPDPLLTATKVDRSLDNLVNFRHHLPDPNLELHNEVLPSPVFTLFTKLPSELQLKVWRAIFPKPRKFFVKLGDSHNHFPDRISVSWSKIFCPSNPIALHVCHDSRTEALPHFKVLCYNKSLGWQYFNLSADTVHTKNIVSRGSPNEVCRAYLKVWGRQYIKNLEVGGYQKLWVSARVVTQTGTLTISPAIPLAMGFRNLDRLIFIPRKRTKLEVDNKLNNLKDLAEVATIYKEIRKHF